MADRPITIDDKVRLVFGHAATGVVTDENKDGARVLVRWPASSVHGPYELWENRRDLQLAD